MEVLSGILLTGVILGIIGYLLREALGDQAGDVFRKYAETSPEAINDNMVGEIAQVVDFKDGAEHMKVRIRGERWNANLIGGRGLAAVGDDDDAGTREPAHLLTDDARRGRV